ncbi:AGE family epimerase/isomerase [Phenylobacterium sp.]|uniref:AGE family epimerase/isomerase n=1 Tax=Phenylobacterium sp. TaxID=1871053 RepID=UPI002F924958
MEGRSGGFHEALTLAGLPIGGVRRARVQARQIWVFATAAAAGFGHRYAAVAERGLAHLLATYKRRDGLFVFAMDSDHEAGDETAALYEQAFVLLALAARGRLDEARRLRDALQALRHPAGGWREAGDRPFQANAHMHLLEAALAWEMTGDASWANMADEIASLAMRRFIDPESGLLQEFFDAEWRALPDASGGLVEPGHQFEWAFLLDEWGKSRGEARARAAARRLYANGLAGVDHHRGVVVGSLWSDLSVRDAVARLWAQTERLRAAVSFGEPGEVIAAAQALGRFLRTPVAGVWRERMGVQGEFLDQPAPATSLYHLMSGLLPLLQRQA